MLSVYAPTEAVCSLSDNFYGRLEAYCRARLGGCLLTRRGEEGDYPVPHVAVALGVENIRRVFAWLAAYLKEMRAAAQKEDIEIVGERLRKACGLQEDDE